jgi:hypothetical protein
MKSLQNQYILVKEGKISKEHFLKQARTLFPQYINQYSTFNTAVNTLSKKNVLSENLGVVVTKGANQDWFKVFSENIKEAKAVEKNPTKEVTDMETRGYNYEDKNNIDNIYGNQFLDGYYTEMKDPKNAKKTVDELKAIVAKNLAKDFSYYTKNGQFGVNGVGYTDEAPSLGKNTQPTSKNASVLGGRDEVNSESEIVKNSLVGKTKFTKKSLKEGIGMFNDPVGYKKSEPNPIDQVYTKEYKGNGIYVIYKNDEEVKTIEGKGNADEWINNEKSKLKKISEEYVTSSNKLREVVRSLVKQSLKERTQQEIDAEKKGISDEINAKNNQKKGLDASINALKNRQNQINAEKPTDTTGA